MYLLSRLSALWRNLVHRGRVERDLDDEVRTVFDLVVDQRMQAGMDLEDARRAATLELGRVENMKEQVRDVRAGALVDSVLLDLRYAFHTLWRRPGPAVAAVGMLALAIGVTTAMFTVVDALLLRPVPFLAPDQLAHVWMGNERGGRVTVAPAVLRGWRESAAFSGAESAEPDTALIEFDGSVVTRGIARVTPGIFDLLGGVQPIRGRLFDPSEGRAGSDDRVLLSEDLWRALYHADPTLVGRRLMIDGESLVVVGILPSEFRFRAVSNATALQMTVFQGQETGGDGRHDARSRDDGLARKPRRRGQFAPCDGPRRDRDTGSRNRHPCAAQRGDRARLYAAHRCDTPGSVLHEPDTCRRTLQPSDAYGEVMVGERLAQALWPGLDPIGRTFTFEQERFHVVGLVREIHHPSLDPAVDRPEFYEPFGGVGSYAMLSLRCSGTCPDPAVIRQRVVAAHPAVRVVDIRALDDAYFEQLARPRASATLGFAFAFIPLLAAAGGLFSVLSYAVARRRCEFGIRTALGASPRQIGRRVVRDGAVVALTGLAVGAVAAWSLGRVLMSLQYGVTMTDPVTWTVVLGLVAVTTAMASWYPARHAMLVDPVLLLREE